MSKVQPTNAKNNTKRDIPCNQKTVFAIKNAFHAQIYVYNVGMKKNRGFTVVEAAITLGILAIALAMAAVAFSNLGNIQRTATDQLLSNRELTATDNLVSRYISFVSIKTDDLSFSYVDAGEQRTVSFKTNVTNYQYDLVFENKTLSISNDYSGSDDFFKFEESQTFQMIDDIKFDYDDSLGLLVSEITYLSNKTIRYSYIVRTAL